MQPKRLARARQYTQSRSEHAVRCSNYTVPFARLEPCSGPTESPEPSLQTSARTPQKYPLDRAAICAAPCILSLFYSHSLISPTNFDFIIVDIYGIHLIVARQSNSPRTFTMRSSRSLAFIENAVFLFSFCFIFLIVFSCRCSALSLLCARCAALSTLLFHEFIFLFRSFRSKSIALSVVLKMGFSLIRFHINTERHTETSARARAHTHISHGFPPQLSGFLLLLYE